MATITVLSELGRLGAWIKGVFALLPLPVISAFFLLFVIIIFFCLLKMLH